MGRSLEGPYTFLPGDLIGVGLQSPWLARKPVRAGTAMPEKSSATIICPFAMAVSSPCAIQRFWTLA